MQRMAHFASAAASTALFVCAARADVVDTRALSETIDVPANTPLVVVVKNVIGPVRVIGHDGNRVEMRATETVRGDLQADIERARAQMQLRTESEPGAVAFRVRPTDDDRDRQRWGWDGYTV